MKISFDSSSENFRVKIFIKVYYEIHLLIDFGKPLFKFLENSHFKQFKQNNKYNNHKANNKILQRPYYNFKT